MVCDYCLANTIKELIYFYHFACVLHVDEEIGGGTGMKQFVKTDDFKAMNLGFALDEGMQDSIFALPHANANNVIKY